MELPLSVNDELQILKEHARKLGKNVISIEKVGNGNMSAFNIRYCNQGEDRIRTEFFWRHAMDAFIAQWQ